MYIVGSHFVFTDHNDKETIWEITVGKGDCRCIYIEDGSPDYHHLGQTGFVSTNTPNVLWIDNIDEYLKNKEKNKGRIMEFD